MAVQPWEQRSDESTQAYQAFLVYLDMGPARTLHEAYRRAGNPDSTQASGCWRDWSKQYGWLRRARLFDARVSKGQTDAKIEAADRSAKVLAEKRLQLLFEIDEKAVELGKALIAQAERVLAFPVVQTSTSDNGTAVTIEPINVLQLRQIADAAQRGIDMVREAIESRKELLRDQSPVDPQQADLMDSADVAARQLSAFRAEQRRLIMNRPTSPPGKPAEEA